MSVWISSIFKKYMSSTIHSSRIIISSKIKCKSIKVYSAANRTSIQCGVQYNACAASEFYVGELDTEDVPTGLTVNDFSADVFESAIIECSGESGCNKANITIQGNFIRSPMVVSTGLNGFAIGRLDCNLGMLCVPHNSYLRNVFMFFNL